MAAICYGRCEVIHWRSSSWRKERNCHRPFTIYFLLKNNTKVEIFYFLSLLIFISLLAQYIKQTLKNTSNLILQWHCKMARKAIKLKEKKFSFSFPLENHLIYCSFHFVELKLKTFFSFYCSSHDLKTLKKLYYKTCTSIWY